MRSKRPAPTRAAAVAVSVAALFSVAALLGALAPEASAAPALPLPLPVAAPESLIGEGLTIEGPLVQNVSLPTLK
ncbi:hypothetical protein AB0I77_35895 [Streptomyces sp. NPDC050619]|uniref:hypothetical protein n=1 Tax=Streptomyces sp. NPDC050619 TaxID=3157214 RepID=UPI0034131BD0